MDEGGRSSARAVMFLRVPPRLQHIHDDWYSLPQVKHFSSSGYVSEREPKPHIWAG
jgi:hypothetical protein